MGWIGVGRLTPYRYHTEATGAIGTSSPVMLIRSRACSRRRWQDRVQKLVSPLSLAFDRAEQIVSSLPG